MTTISSQAERAILRTLLVGRPLWLALHSSSPGMSGVSELAGTPRQSVRFVEKGKGWVNTDSMDFPTSEGNVRWLGVWDAERGGHFILGAQTVDTEVSTGDTYTVPEGAVTVGVRT